MTVLIELKHGFFDNTYWSHDLTNESQLRDDFSPSQKHTFAKIPLARQLAASEAMADHLMATNSVDPEISRREIVKQCHTLLLALPDSAFL